MKQLTQSLRLNLRLFAYMALVLGLLFPSLLYYMNASYGSFNCLTCLLKDIGVAILNIFISGLLIYSLIHLINRLMGHKKHRWYRYVLESVLVAVIILSNFDIQYNWIFNIYTLQTNPNEFFDALHYRQYQIMSTLAGILVYAFLATVNFTEQMQQTQNEAIRIQKEFAQTRLQALKNQVNPHFLFNSLSVLTSLVHIDADLSEQFIEQLSKAYRYILEQKDKEVVTLRTELDFVRSYIFLLKIRFENKFDVRFNIPADQMNTYLPPLTLQLLVENAVKHNQMSVDRPLIINIQAEPDQYLVVSNTMRARTQDEKSTGIGLPNIQSRYSYLTNLPISAGAVGDEYIVRIPLLAETALKPIEA
ncbi:histidine kinase [Nibrella saemangeumensis]|uniref:Histidine kinase n=1 Tax=Nibrella saemangeumensis TaxID=1084526 RepID=A0ABP8MLG8_9BACT